MSDASRADAERPREPRPGEAGWSPGPFVPQGMPPGTEYAEPDERPPDAVYYFRIYAALYGTLYALLVLFGLVMMFEPLWGPRSAGAAAGDAVFLITGLFYSGIGAMFLAPAAIALFGGRRSWVHTVGTVVIGMGMLQLCCIPILVPLLLAWMKPETRAWYGAR